MGRRSHRLFARYYPKAADSLEDRGFGEQRARLLAGLGGRVLEVGCGHGANFAHYPDAVTELVAVEPEEALRDLALERAGALGLKATVLKAQAEKLDFENDSFDAVVTTLVLCSVEDQDRAATEILRVLKPGASLVLLEHIGSTKKAVRLGEQVFDAVFWSHVFGGCHTGRRADLALERAGLDLSAATRRRFPEMPFPLNMTTHLFGPARKPE